MTTTHRKEVLTTGEVARLCHVAPRTVSKWFDTGKLRGYRIPGSRDRRIPLSGLLAFMRVHGIPLEGMDGGVCRIMILGNGRAQAWQDALASNHRYEIRRAGNGFDAGVIAQQYRPHVVVLECGDNTSEAAMICRNIKNHPDLSTTRVIAVLTTPGTQGDNGFDVVLSEPVTMSDLAGAIERATDFLT